MSSSQYSHRSDTVTHRHTHTDTQTQTQTPPLSPISSLSDSYPTSHHLSLLFNPSLIFSLLPTAPSPSLLAPPSLSQVPPAAAAWCAQEQPPAWGTSGPGWRKDAGSEGHREERVRGLGRTRIYLPAKEVLHNRLPLGGREFQRLLSTLLNSTPGAHTTGKERWAHSSVAPLHLPLQASTSPTFLGTLFFPKPPSLSHLVHLLAGWLQHLVGPNALGCSHQALLLFTLADLLIDVSQERLHSCNLGEGGVWKEQLGSTPCTSHPINDNHSILT